MMTLQPQHQPARVLLVEDDEIISEAIVYNLKRQGYLCHTALDGLEGLRQVRRQNPDLLILDLMLPQLDGWKLCEQIRREDYRFPIIICSARTAESDKVTGLSLGADDFITKPFGMAELVARVGANLRRARGEREPAAAERIVAAPLVIDPGSREVLADGEAVELTRKEFAILHHLAACSPRIVPRDEIYRTVWGYEFMPGDRSVDVFVRRLRKKLKAKLPQYKFLHTSYGFGYKFQAIRREAAGKWE